MKTRLRSKPIITQISFSLIISFLIGSLSSSANAVSAPTITSLSVTSATTSGGTVTVITGSNLSNATSVLIGGASAAIDTNTSVSISIRTPAISAGVQDVSVTTAGGTATKTGGIAVYTTLTPACGTSGYFTIVNNQITNQTSCVGSVNMPEGVTDLLWPGFSSDLDITDVTIPTTLKTLGNNGNNYGVFYNSGITSVTFTPGGSLTTITNGVFRDVSRLAYIDLPRNITTLGPLAFSDYVPGSSLKWIRIPSTVTNIDTVSVYGALKSDVPLTCIITPADNTMVRSLTFISQYGTRATPIFVTDVANCPAPTVSSVSPSSGSANGGTSLTISGTNLFTVTGVTIGGASATITSSNSNNTSLTIRTPSGSVGSQSIILTTPGPTNTGSPTYSYLAPPTFASIAITSGSGLGGTVDTVTGTNLSGASVKVGGVSATAVSSTSTTVTFTTPAGTPGAKDVVITTAVDSVTAFGVFTYIAPPSSSVLAPTLSGPASRTTPVTLSVNVNTPGTVRFMYNGRLITGFSSRSTTGTSPSYSATCFWKPILQGPQTVSALFTPTDISYGIATSPATTVYVLKRNTPR